MNSLKQKKLVVVASTFPRWEQDSVPSFVLDHARHLRELFKDVLVIAPHYKGAKKREVMQDVHVKRFRYAWPASAQNIVYDTHASKAVRKTPVYAVKLLFFLISQWLSLVIHGQGAIVNAHWVIPQGFVALLARPLNRSKVVISIHGGDVFTLNGKLMRAVKRFALKHADMVIANSSATKRACEDLYPAREYKVIPMGVDVETIINASSPKRDKTYTVIFVGRLSKEKGAQYLCRAADLLKNEAINFKIIGDGPQRRELEKYVIAHNLNDAIEFTGWVQPQELPKFLKSADIFVGPSIADANGWQEAFGLVFVEAAAASLPVIATDTGGIKDIVIDGNTGFLVKQKNSQQIAEKILRLKNNKELRSKMSQQSIEQAKNFSWKITTEKYQRIFEHA